MQEGDAGGRRRRRRGGGGGGGARLATWLPAQANNRRHLPTCVPPDLQGSYQVYTAKKEEGRIESQVCAGHRLECACTQDPLVCSAL